MVASATRVRDHDGLSEHLAELAATTPVLEELQLCEVRGHLAGVRSYLHDEILPSADAEEVALFPLLAERGSSASAGLILEHRTVRRATETLDEAAERPFTRAAIHQLAGLLRGTDALLADHLAHETDAFDDLDPVTDDGRTRALPALSGAGPQVRRCARPTWLPEDLPQTPTIGSATRFEPEALVGSSIAPTIQAVARSAIAAATEGADAASWRTALVTHSRYRLQVPGAEQCMRASGLWPWAHTS
jgi:hypothetical protein